MPVRRAPARTHATQNGCLQATALGLGTVVIGAFENGSVRRPLGMRGDEEPLYLMPVGRLRKP